MLHYLQLLSEYGTRVYNAQHARERDARISVLPGLVPTMLALPHAEGQKLVRGGELVLVGVLNALMLQPLPMLIVLFDGIAVTVIMPLAGHCRDIHHQHLNPHRCTDHRQYPCHHQ